MGERLYTKTSTLSIQSGCYIRRLPLLWSTALLIVKKFEESDLERWSQIFLWTMYTYITKSPTVQDTFWLIPGLISCAAWGASWFCFSVNLFLTPSTETSSMLQVNRNINATGQSNLIFYIISQLCTKYRLLLALIQAFFGSSISLQLHTSYRAATKVITRPIPNMQIIVRMCTCVLLRRLDAKYLCSVHLM